jgi:hypothetical protein
VDFDAARDLYAAASRAAQDHLLDVMNAQRDGHPDTIRAAVTGLVAAQRAALDAHQHVVDAADQHGVDHDDRLRLDAEHAQLRDHLAAVEHALDRLTTPAGEGVELELRGIDLSVPVAASADDMLLVADRLQRAARIADRAGAPVLVGPLLDAAHLLRRTATDGDAGGPAADLAAALLGYQDHIPMP